ncbi:hypothetical protein Trydic_g3706 [Trypoxylus dichotomus]
MNCQLFNQAINRPLMSYEKAEQHKRHLEHTNEGKKQKKRSGYPHHPPRPDLTHLSSRLSPGWPLARAHLNPSTAARKILHRTENALTRERVRYTYHELNTISTQLNEELWKSIDTTVKTTCYEKFKPKNTNTQPELDICKTSHQPEYLKKKSSLSGMCYPKTASRSCRRNIDIKPAVSPGKLAPARNITKEEKKATTTIVAGYGPIQEANQKPYHEGRNTNQRRLQGIINPKGRIKKTITIREPTTKTVRTAKDTQTRQPSQTDR